MDFVFFNSKSVSQALMNTCPPTLKQKKSTFLVSVEAQNLFCFPFSRGLSSPWNFSKFLLRREMYDYTILCDKNFTTFLILVS